MCLLGKYVCDFWYSENKCALKKQDLWQVLKENCPLVNYPTISDGACEVQAHEASVV